MNVIAECPICGINVYDRGNKNRSFICKRKTYSGYPEIMPCGINCTDPTLAEDKVGGRCPFETEQEQSLNTNKWAKLPIPGNSNYD